MRPRSAGSLIRWTARWCSGGRRSQAERWGGGEWMGGGKAIIDGDWDVNSEGKCEWFCSTRRWESLKWSHWQGENGLCEGERGVETPKLWFDNHQLLQFSNSFQHLTTDHHKVHLGCCFVVRPLNAGMKNIINEECCLERDTPVLGIWKLSVCCSYQGRSRVVFLYATRLNECIQRTAEKGWFFVFVFEASPITYFLLDWKFSRKYQWCELKLTPITGDPPGQTTSSSSHS